MNIFKKVAKKIAAAPKHFKALALLASTMAVVSGAVFAGWTSTGIVYDWNNPDDRKGSLNGPVFNSFINTPYYGDERTFFDARMSDGGAGSTKDVLPYVTSGTKEVILRTYVHNNANQSTNASGVGVAKGVKVRIDLPTGTDTAMRMRSYISATNAKEVTDTAELVDSKAFGVSYVAGSARMYNSANPNGATLSDTIVTTGAPIGYNTPNGEVPGCFDYQTFVEIRVKIVVPEVSIVKEVKNPTDTAWKKETTVKPGETIKWMVTVKNTGTARLDETTVSDALPPHMSVVPGSVKRTDALNNGVVQSDTALFTTGGINFKSYAATVGVLYIRFDTTAKSDFEGCEVRVRNQAFVKSAQTPTEKKDTADVVIKKDNCTPPVQSVRCDALTAPKYTVKPGEELVFTAAATATNTTVTSYEFSVNGVVKQNTASNTYTFKQNATGTYDVTVEVKSPIGSTTSSSCAKKVDVVQEVSPIYRCDALTVAPAQVKTGEKVNVTLKFTAKDGASFKLATINFGDGKSYMTNNSKDGVVETDHTYTVKGSYGVTARIEFTVNGQTKVVEGGNCVSQVVVNDVPVTPPTIPDTGAGSVAALFASVSAAGAVMYNIIARRSVRE